MADSQNSVDNGTVNASFVARRNASGAGTVCFVGAAHQDTTNPASTGVLIAQSTAASGADAFMNCTLASTRSWGWGIDASDSAALKETTFPAGSTDPSTGTLTRKVTVGGVQTMPLQPAFFAQMTASTVGGVTGAGAVYTLGNNSGGTLTVVTDRGSNTSFPGGNFTYTFPVTGIYLLGWQICLGNITAAMTSGGSSMAFSGGGNINGMGTNPGVIANAAGNIFLTQQVSLLCVGGNSVVFRYQITGGAGNTANVISGNGVTNVYGCLLA